MSNADTEKQKLVLETLAKHLMRAPHTSNGSNTELCRVCKTSLKSYVVHGVPVVLH